MDLADRNDRVFDRHLLGYAFAQGTDLTWNHLVAATLGVSVEDWKAIAVVDHPANDLAKVDLA